jgi:hypothetical protein
MQIGATDGGYGRGDAPEAVADEDRLSAVALQKTVAWFLYTLATIVAVEAFMVMTNRVDLPDPASNTWRLALLGLIEPAVLFLVLLGVLPGSRGARVRGFTDRQFVMAVSALSLIPLLLGFSPLSATIFRGAMNGFLVIGVLVFFVTKSAVSGRVRLKVLGGLVLPLAQLVYGPLGPLAAPPVG